MSQQQQIEQLRHINSQLQAKNAGLELANSKLREYFKAANLRSIINTKSVQIFAEIETAVERVRNREQLPESTINYISTLLEIIHEEAQKQ